MNFSSNNSQFQPDGDELQEYLDLVAQRKEPEPEPDNNLSRIKRETQWRLDEPLPNTIPNAARVAKGLEPCSVCGDRGDLRRIRTGVTTGAIDLREYGCPCQKFKAYIHLLNRDVPEHDRHIRFNTLAPSERSFMPLDLQERLIDHVKANPEKNFSFYGPAGWSKTTLCLALWDYAVREELDKAFVRCGSSILEWAKSRGCSVWRVSAKRILRELSEYENHDYSEERPPEPVVTEQRIRSVARNGYRPRLFIEEIDKIGNLTKARLNSLFELIQAVHAENGQICLNSNQSIPEFEAAFGADVFRRLSEPENSIVIDLFNLQPKNMEK